MTTTTLRTTRLPAAATTDRPTEAPSRVPWSTVLPLAVPLGLAAGFWTVALRTSLGSIERTTGPFVSWMRESALLLPFFVLAVLAALTLAQRRFGRDPSTFREMGAVSALVAGFGTLAGIGELALSSAYDYHLQVHQLTMMTGMRDDCPTACQSAIQQATLRLQEREVIIGGLILLVTNVVVVAWVVALRGGRLRLTSPGTSGPRVLDRLGLTRVLLVSGLVGSAAIHAAVVPAHLAEWTAAGIFFVLLTAGELGLAAAVLVRRDRWLAMACVAVSVGPLLVWSVSRTVGLPFGPERGVPEPVGLADVVACALEILTVAAAVALLRARTRSGAPRAGIHQLRLALVLVVAVTALGLGGTTLRWVGMGAGDQAATSHAPASTSGNPAPVGPLNHR